MRTTYRLVRTHNPNNNKCCVITLNQTNSHSSEISYSKWFNSAEDALNSLHCEGRIEEYKYQNGGAVAWPYDATADGSPTPFNGKKLSEAKRLLNRK